MTEANKEAFKSLENGAQPAEKKEAEPPKEPKKRGQGRPTNENVKTKLNSILANRGMSRTDLYRAIEAKYPDEPMSLDAVSRIVTGSRKYYSLHSLYRICGTLGITPNMALNWEEEVQ